MAEWAFRKSTEYGPDRPLAYNNLGSALNAQGRWNEAIAVLEHALSLDPFGGVCVAGDTSSTDFPVQSAVQANNAGRTDGFITKYTAGGVVIFSTYLGGAA